VDGNIEHNPSAFQKKGYMWAWGSRGREFKTLMKYEQKDRETVLEGGTKPRGYWAATLGPKDQGASRAKKKQRNK